MPKISNNVINKIAIAGSSILFGIVTYVVVWWILQVVVLETSKGPEVRIAAEYNYQPIRGCAPQELSQVISPSEREVQRRECENQRQDHRRELDDLVQQARAAGAVEGANLIALQNFRLSLGQLYFSIVSALALGLSLFLNWRAISTTREIGEAQVRAYLSIEQANHAVMPRGDIIFELSVKNYGQSPAQNVLYNFECICILNERFPHSRLPDGMPAIAGHKSTKLYTSQMWLGDIPVGGTAHSGKIVLGDRIVPDDALLNAEGRANIQAVVFQASGFDVFEQKVTATTVSREFKDGWAVAYAAMLEEDAHG